jgi:hypothetical protein
VLSFEENSGAGAKTPDREVSALGQHTKQDDVAADG